MAGACNRVPADDIGVIVLMETEMGEYILYTQPSAEGIIINIA